MDSQVLGVGIIGCGRIFDLHMRGYQEREDAAVLAVADVSEERRAARQGEYGIPRAYADYREMLDDPSIQLVEILTPHHLHREMTIAAAEAGKHVSLQKPPALDLGEMDEIIAAAKAAGVALRVYENFVFYPPIVRAKALIDEGAIGQPLNIRMRTLSGSAAGGWEVPLEAWAWRMDERTCGGGPFVFDDGYHKFSVALYLLGDVEKVFCWMESLSLGEGLCVDAPSICIWKYRDANIFGSMTSTSGPTTTPPTTASRSRARRASSGSRAATATCWISLPCSFIARASSPPSPTWKRTGERVFATPPATSWTPSARGLRPG